MTSRSRKKPPTTKSAERPAPRLPAIPLVPALAILLIAAIAVWFLILEHRIAGEWGFALDDSWIHATIARNVATGHGFAFNPGEPVAGSTGPLYTLLLAFLYWFTRESVWTAKALGLVCHAATALLAGRAVRRLAPESPLSAAMASLLVATSPALLWGALSGMEIPLYLLLIVAGTVAWIEDRDRLASLLWALGVWVRPDGIFLLAVVLAVQPRRALGRMAIMAPVVLGFFAFNYAMGGTIFPQTVGVKAHFGIHPILRTWNLLREWGALWGVPYRSTDQLEHPVLLLPLLLIGAWAVFRRWPAGVLYAIGLPVAFSLFREHSASHKRYLLPVIPFGMMLVGLGAAVVSRWPKRFEPRRVLVGLLVATLAIQATILPSMAEDYAWNVQNINKMQRLLANFAKATTSPGSKIATNDIGAFGYFSDRYVVDLMGLVTPLRPLPEQLSRYEPEEVFVFLNWFEPYLEPDSLSGNYRFWDADSTHRYELIAGIELAKNTICANNRMTAYLRLAKGAPSPAKRYLYRF